MIASFTVEPTTVARGQSAVLRWSVTASNNVSIDHGLGTVPAMGTLSVQPFDTTTYTLTASGFNGDTSATTTLTVTGTAAASREHDSHRAFNPQGNAGIAGPVRSPGRATSTTIRITFERTRAPLSRPTPQR